MVRSAASTGSDISRLVIDSAPRVTITSWAMATIEMTPPRKSKRMAT